MHGAYNIKKQIKIFLSMP
jgi:hypothetical protein